MEIYTTPNGDLFAVDDETFPDRMLTLAAHVVAGDKDAALKTLAQAYEDTRSIEYTTALVQEALTRVVIHLTAAASPSETITAANALNAVTFAIRSLAATANTDPPA